MNVADLADAVRQRRLPALARAITVVENQAPGFEEILSRLHGDVGRAYRIGVTGPPGAGKSTLVDALAGHFRARGLTVAVVAVDPTSPMSGGALLGDRVRMESVASDPGVFIRSMATRGAVGGLAMTTLEVCDLLDAFGFDRIVVETVGVGQSEMAVAATTDTALLVLVPESGDAVQVLKAGVMEVAHIYVVNKNDRPGASQVTAEVGELISIRREIGSDGSEWMPRVLETCATSGDGTGALCDAIEERGEWLTPPRRAQVVRARLIAHTRAVIDRSRQLEVWSNGAVRDALDRRINEVLQGELSTYDLARQLLDTRPLP
jgi:LAO/AO transport system kinase